MKLITIISLYAITNAHKLPKLISKNDQRKLQQLANQHLGQVSSQAQQAAGQGLQAAQNLADQYQLKNFDGNPIDVKELQKLVQKNGQRSLQKSLPTMREVEKKAEELADQVAKDIKNYYQDNKNTINHNLSMMKRQNLREVFDGVYKRTYNSLDHPDRFIERDIKTIVKSIYLETIKRAGGHGNPLDRGQPDLGKLINLIEREVQREGPRIANEIKQMGPQLGDQLRAQLRDLDRYVKRSKMAPNQLKAQLTTQLRALDRYVVILKRSLKNI